MKKKQSCLEYLSELAYKAKTEKYPSVPEYAHTKKKYKDTTANELTDAIIKYVQLIGGYAVRINTQGQWNESLQKWTAGQTTKGTADIHACLNGKHYSIEVKSGKDTQSEHQQKCQAAVEKSGGVYFLCRTFEEIFEMLKSNEKK